MNYGKGVLRFFFSDRDLLMEFFCLFLRDEPKRPLDVFGLSVNFL